MHEKRSPDTHLDGRRRIVEGCVEPQAILDDLVCKRCKEYSVVDSETDEEHAYTGVREDRSEIVSVKESVRVKLTEEERNGSEDGSLTVPHFSTELGGVGGHWWGEQRASSHSREKPSLATPPGTPIAWPQMKIVCMHMPSTQLKTDSV